MNQILADKISMADGISDLKDIVKRMQTHSPDANAEIRKRVEERVKKLDSKRAAEIAVDLVSGIEQDSSNQSLYPVCNAVVFKLLTERHASSLRNCFSDVILRANQTDQSIAVRDRLSTRINDAIDTAFLVAIENGQISTHQKDLFTRFFYAHYIPSVFSETLVTLAPRIHENIDKLALFMRANHETAEIAKQRRINVCVNNILNDLTACIERAPTECGRKERVYITATKELLETLRDQYNPKNAQKNHVSKDELLRSLEKKNVAELIEANLSSG